MVNKEFNNLEEIKKYYNKYNNTYIFKENGDYIQLVTLNFDLDVKANINALNINAQHISVNNIDAWNINAYNINANRIYVNNINAWNINAGGDIKAHNINAKDIKSGNIKAGNIDADNIDYLSTCTATNSIRCKSIAGRKKNAKHTVLDGTLEVTE